MTDKTEIFESMPVRPAVRKMVFPAVISQMIVMVYGLADTYFVGLLNDSTQSAALSVTTSFILMLTAISNLFGIGGAGAFAAARGQHKDRDASRISSICFWFGLLSSIIFSICIFVFLRPILTVCGATDDTYELAAGYVIWTVVLGGPGTILNLLLANLIRADGNSRMASIGITGGGILNIILDPIFILPGLLDMGVVGAGIATGISNLIAAVILLMYIIHKRNETLLSLRLSNLSYTRRLIGSVLSKGVPSAVQYALTVVAVAAAMKFVSAYDTAAVAGYGIAKKVYQIPVYFTIGVSTGILPMLAYNYAAENRERQRQVFRYACGIAICFSVIILILYEVFASEIASIFISDSDTVSYAASFLRRMATAVPLVAFNYPMLIQFQAMGKMKESTILALIRKGVIDVPLLYLFDLIEPLYGLMWVLLMIDLIAMAVTLCFYFRIRRKEGTY